MCEISRARASRLVGCNYALSSTSAAYDGSTPTSVSRDIPINCGMATLDVLLDSARVRGRKNGARVKRLLNLEVACGGVQQDCVNYEFRIRKIASGPKRTTRCDSSRAISRRCHRARSAEARGRVRLIDVMGRSRRVVPLAAGIVKAIQREGTVTVPQFARSFRVSRRTLERRCDERGTSARECVHFIWCARVVSTTTGPWDPDAELTACCADPRTRRQIDRAGRTQHTFEADDAGVPRQPANPDVAVARRGHSRRVGLSGDVVRRRCRMGGRLRLAATRRPVA